ncbi:hypothetical protein HYFRA_00010975 [Hymenoscyphus fraxineus]|uniref:Glucose-methanol-choline oxidoreductase N-terminal domain-containing protein n=1 Tax=Hymenoscyphus fraxineus TaxID=746836 RepID=A0A9N9KXJ8_9HELO|nr:hypothetical protein HYFRA_00010975 [Hymenoscyphus fraxineus]
MASVSKQYDFIIVGGGTAGLVLAARLTESPDLNVLVLEAGENHISNPNINIPALWPALLGTDLDWNFSTKELQNRNIGIPHGRVLGGSSALNAQAFVGPSRVGLDSWKEFGNPGWDWANMEEYYRKCYNVQIPSEDIRKHLGLGYLETNPAAQHGPLQTSYPDSKDEPIVKAWMDTLNALNYKITGDPLSGGSTGAFVHPSTVDGTTKERSYSATAYYLPAQKRRNLHVITGAEVEKILFDSSSGLVIATGVKYSKSGISDIVKANKEVILAAGAIHSPKILELSGIGGSSLLQSKGIDVVVHNEAVGENFHDHPMSGMSFEVAEGVNTLDALNRQDPEVLGAAMTAYQTMKSGPFSKAAINSYALLPVVDFQSEEGKTTCDDVLKELLPDISNSEHEFVRSVYSSADKSSGCYFVYAAHGNFGADNSTAKAVTVNDETANFLTIACELSYPLSRGSVHISTSSAFDRPTIDPAYYSNPLDLEIQARHVRFFETIVKTDPLASLLKTGGIRSPGFANIGDDLDAAKEYIRRTSISGWHPVGTCAMKPKEAGGVVNPRLLVYGTRNLRVVDASIMPFICRGNTQSTVYAIAEKAADIIKEDFKISN